MVIALVLIFSLNVFAVEVSFEALKNLVESKNERVIEHKKKLEAAQLREGVFLRSYLPKVSVSGGYETFEVGTSTSKQQPYYALETSMNIYNGGKDHLQEQRQELSTARKQSEVKIVIAEELGKARELFWKILYLAKEIELLETMEKLNEKNLKAAQRRVKSGVATPSDRLEFAMKRLDLKRSLKQAEVEKTVMSYDLLVHLGYETDEPLKIEGELKHVDEWEQELQHTHKDHEFFVKPSELLVEELKVQKLQKQRAWTPQLDLYAGWYQWNQREEDPVEERERQESTVGLKLTMNLFDGFSSPKEAQALGAEAQAAMAQSLFYKRKNEAHIEKEFLELKSLHDQVHEAEQHIAMAEKYYRATQSEYVRGAKNSPDVLGATERLESVKRQRNQLVRNFHIARSHVLSKIGK